MVINKFGDRLYNGLVETETAHLRGIAARVEGAQGEGFLRELRLRWEHHNKSMQMVRDILMVRAPRPALPESIAARAARSAQDPGAAKACLACLACLSAALAPAVLLCARVRHVKLGLGAPCDAWRASLMWVCCARCCLTVCLLAASC